MNEIQIHIQDNSAGIYGSFPCIIYTVRWQDFCNIIFTVAAFALGFSRWDQAQGIVRCLIVLGAAFLQLSSRL